eukprot:COSAG06_NODE_3164_length_5749_cov_16.498407_5_plen_60_part_00
MYIVMDAANEGSDVSIEDDKTNLFALALARSPDESVHLVRSTPSRKQRATVIGLKIPQT